MIVARGLGKQFGSVRAVDDLSFTVESGVVTGFLGPNGAGKSTAMRLMLELDHGAGRTEFDGRTYSELKHPARSVGVLLDARAVHPGRTARSHLRMVAAGASIPADRVDDVLDMVGLTDVANQRAGGFSLGMSQRLGLAAALMGNPAALLLDEPANGLDPAGVRWLRDLLKALAAEGRTIFVSSHLLTEMTHVADSLVVISGGKLVAAEALADFVTRHARPEVVTRTDRPAELVDLLRRSGHVATARADGAIVVEGADADAVSAIAMQAGIALQELAARTASLEDAFFAATSDGAQYRAQTYANN